MSFQDDYKDLETRLRQSKPKTEPLPPALKRQMRQELMEQMTMKENPFTFRKLSMALGGLIILIGIPVFFWLAQMSVGTAVNPGAGGPTAEPNQLDPARPTIAAAGDEIELPVVETATDKVWLISADTPPGQTVGRNQTLNLTIGYELVNVEEAELIVKLVDGSRGVLEAQKMVSGANGTAVIPLPLSDLQDITGESIALQLNLILRDPAPTNGRLLYLDFVEGWTIDLTAEPSDTMVEINHISKPNIVETDGIVNESVYEIELTTSYSLSGYDSAVMVVGYEFADNNGKGGGYEINAISAGNREISSTHWISRDFFNERGELIDGVNFFARINRYDEELSQWVNIYPGNVALGDGERNLPYPYYEDSFFVQSAAFTDDTTGQTVLNVTLGYNLVSQPMADVLVEINGVGEAFLASEGIILEQGSGTVTIPLVIDRSTLEANGIVQVTAVLTTPDFELQDSQSVVFHNPEFTAENAAELWIIATDIVTRTTANGVAVDITLVVGYELSNEYSGGRIDFTNQYQASNSGGRGGGGGGSTAAITPGNGTTEFVFGFETTSWAIARDWLDTMSTYLKLFGYSTTGEEILISEAYKIGTD